jgi:hypothetical protein
MPALGKPSTLACMLAFGLVRSQQDQLPHLHCRHSPQQMVKGTTTRSPTLSLALSFPTSTTSPMVSWPSTSPFSMVGT